MLIGNGQAVQTLKTFINSTIQKGSGPQFFLLVGLEGIGKSAHAQQVIHEILGEFTYSDLLFLKDYSSDLGKEQTIPVEITSSNQIVELLDGTRHQNYGVRELNLWLQQSGFAPQKFVLIENIQRMSLSAMNAFLKTAEEPLPGRFIIATTTHISQVLDTILSRSIQISFFPLSEQEMETFAKDIGGISSSNDQSFHALLLNMAMGKPGMLIKLSKQFKDNPELKQEIKKLTQWLSLSTESIPQAKMQQSLKKLADLGILEDFLDGRVAYATELGFNESAKHRLKVKKLAQANINLENLLRYGVI